MHSGIKCIVCVERALRNQVVNTAEPVQRAADGAKLAVVTRNGDSLCVEHLHERMVARAASDLGIVRGMGEIRDATKGGA